MFTYYSDFINESKLQLLLEANIVYTSNFLNVLDSINSPISKTLISLNGTDHDIERNYIDISTKNDSVLFKPQDKIDKANYILTSVSSVYESLSIKAQKLGIISNYQLPQVGTVGKIVKKFTLEELVDLSGGLTHWKEMYKSNKIMVIFRFNSKFFEDTQHEIMVTINDLIKDVRSVKSTEVTIGRFVRSFLLKLGYKYSDKEIENFVDQYKKVIQLNNGVFSRFREVKGDDIKKYYLENSYESSAGSLGGSCMRYRMCQEFFSIYTENPERVSMIILMSEDDSNKISGRAILWLDDLGRYITDRIYTIRTSDILLFIEYCDSKGYYHKENQSFLSNTPLILKDKELKDNSVYISLNNINYGYFPYMDTMKYYNPKLAIISNIEPEDNSIYYTLTDTDGGGDGVEYCGVCLGTGIVNCPECDGARVFNCPDCQGVGVIDDVTCDSCGGYGIEDCDVCQGDGRVGCPECN